MCHVAGEMERQGFDLPLLIGGATTSRVHTAVKTTPTTGAARRSMSMMRAARVGVAQNLMSNEARPRYVADIRAEYARIAEAHARGEPTSSGSRSRTRARTPLKLNCRALRAAAAWLPRHQGPRRLFAAELSLHRLDAVLRHLGADGKKYPAISDDATVGRRRARCQGCAGRCCQKIADERWFRAAARGRVLAG